MENKIRNKKYEHHLIEPGSLLGTCQLKGSLVYYSHNKEKPHVISPRLDFSGKVGQKKNGGKGKNLSLMGSMNSKILQKKIFNSA